MKELRLEVGEEAAADWIAAVFRDRGDGEVQPGGVPRFVATELRRAGLSEGTSGASRAHRGGIQHVLSSLGGVAR